MVLPASNLGSGFALTFDGLTLEITSARWDGIERASVETTHHGTPAPAAGNIGNRTFVPGAYVNPGQLEVTGHWAPHLAPPIQAVPGSLVATWPSTGVTTPATWTCAEAFTMSMNVEGLGLDEEMMVNATIKMSGPIVFVDAIE